MKTDVESVVVTGFQLDMLKQVYASLDAVIPAEMRPLSEVLSGTTVPPVTLYVMSDLSDKHLYNLTQIKRNGCEYLVVFAEHLNVPVLCDIVRAHVDDVVLSPVHQQEMQRLQNVLLPMLGKQAQQPPPSASEELDEFSVHSAIAFEEIVQHVEGQFCNKLTLVTVARQMNLSPSRISHLFKDVCGICFRQYLMCRRLEEAENLLIYPKANITSVALSLGFASPSHFCRAFKETFGITPTSYQSGNREFVVNHTFARYQHLRLTLLPQIVRVANQVIPAQRLRMSSVG